MLKRTHSPAARDVLRKASLSMNSELDEAQVARLDQAVEWYAEDPKVSGERLRHFIMPPSNEPVGDEPTGNEGEITMATATSKRGGRPARPALSKAIVTKLAKLRRDGATWAEIDAEADQHRSSTDWAILFEENGFDKTCVKHGSKQGSKARAWNKDSNGKPAKAADKPKRVRKTKATAKK